MRLTSHHSTLLAICGVLFLSTGCDEVADAAAELASRIGDDDRICLDEFLEFVGSSRADLGANADERIEQFMTTQQSALGTALVIDCVARAQPLPEPAAADYCVALDEDCGGNGICDPANGSCTCDEGYAGVSCERCADDFAALTDGSCAAVACDESACGENGN